MFLRVDGIILLQENTQKIHVNEICYHLYEQILSSILVFFLKSLNCTLYP